MSAVIVRPAPPSRLAKLIQTPGGITLADALARADANLATVADHSLEVLDQALARLAALGGRLIVDPNDAEAREQLYSVSEEAVAVAGVAGQAEVGEVAYSLCDLADRFRETGRFSAASLQVHLTALRWLRQPAGPDDAATRRAMLDGLNRVVKKV